jgi:hypothetical protein
MLNRWMDTFFKDDKMLLSARVEAICTPHPIDGTASKPTRKNQGGDTW